MFLRYVMNVLEKHFSIPNHLVLATLSILDIFSSLFLLDMKECVHSHVLFN